MTDTETRESDTLFRESDEVVGTDFRRTTPWAIVTLLLGLASSLALITPILWAVPIFGIGAGLLALGSIRKNPEVIGGTRLAVIGMGLSALFFSWGASTYYVQSQMSYAHAQIHAARWFELLKTGKVREAHQLRRSHYERVDPTIDLVEYYNRSENREMYITFQTEPVVARLIKMGEDAKLTYVGNLAFMKEGANTYLVTVRFQLESLSGASPPEYVDVELSREYFSATRESRWAIRQSKLSPLGS